MMTLLAAVVRVSHMGARKAGADDFHADTEQLEAVRRYAATLGATVEILPPELSVSGGKPIAERPSLRAAIEGVEAGQYDGIIVAYLSRLTRSRSGLEIWDRVERVGGRVYSAAENLDTSTPNGRFIRDVHLANAVREREEHVDRFANRRHHATAAGIWQRRQTPRGYSRDPDTRRLVPNADADCVRKAFRDRAAGVPVGMIANDLAMTRGGAWALLRNRVYLGELRVGQEFNPAAHPPLIDAEMFEAAQMWQPRQPRRADGPALLAGIARCAGCGHSLTRAATKVPCYRCVVRHSGARCPAPAIIAVHLLEGYVEPIALRELARLSVTQTAGNAVEDARRALADTEAELAAYIQATAALDVAMFAEGARQRQDAVTEAKAALHREIAKRPAIETTTGAEAWDHLDATRRNAVLRGLLACVVVERSGGRGRIRPVAERVRVLRHGADVTLPTNSRSAGYGIVPIPLPDADDPSVLRELAA